MWTIGWATAVAAAVASPPECQPMVGESRWIPQFHAIPEMRPRSGDGLMWPGQVQGLRHIFGPYPTSISAQHHPSRAVGRTLLGGRADEMLIGACDPML